MEFKCMFNGNDKVVIEKLSTGGWLIKNVWVWQNGQDPDRVFETIVSDGFIADFVQFVDNYVLAIPTADLFVYSDTVLRISTELNEYGDINVRFRTEKDGKWVSNYFNVQDVLVMKSFLQGEI